MRMWVSVFFFFLTHTSNWLSSSSLCCPHNVCPSFTGAVLHWCLGRDRLTPECFPFVYHSSLTTCLVDGPGGIRAFFFSLLHVDFVWNLCQTRPHTAQNSASRCTAPQRQTQIWILHCHQCGLIMYLSALKLLHIVLAVHNSVFVMRGKWEDACVLSE